MKLSCIGLVFWLSQVWCARTAVYRTRATLGEQAFAHNDFTCKSAVHPNPVILLHGLGATYYEDINALEAWLKTKDFCTFSITYGAYSAFPTVGGLKPIAESSTEIAAFVKTVMQQTGAGKIDLVGHSEGAFQTLYTAKFGGISSLVEHIVAIAPPTHGTTFSGVNQLAYLFGNASREAVSEALHAVGCAACDDAGSEDGLAIRRLNDGQPIVQAGNKVTIVASRSDEIVTPPSTAFIAEDGVANMYIQDYCPLDKVGHVGEPYDPNVWNLVLNALEMEIGRKFICSGGLPVR